MVCEKCNRTIRMRQATFCPYCGERIEEHTEEELAEYSRGVYFSYLGDDAFTHSWDKVRSMDAKGALAWLRERPPALYVYKPFGDYGWRKGVVDVKEIKGLVSDGGSVEARKYKLSRNSLSSVGTKCFFSKEECESKIKEAIESAE